MGSASRRASVSRMVATTALLVVCAGGGRIALAQPTDPDLAGERAYLDIIQRKDRDLRQRRLDEVLGALEDPQAGPERQEGALEVLARVKDVPFDRTPFLPAVRPLLGSPSEAVRRAALGAMPSAGAGEADLPVLAGLADDPSAAVRARVAGALYASAGGRGADVIRPAVERLLADPSDEVKRATLHALWGQPVSPAAEATIIALSHESMAGGPGALGYDAVYYALSTRPVVGVPVARRLIELMQDPQMDPNIRWRAAWGLGHSATPEAVDLVVEALAAELDETLHPSIRANAVQALATHRTPAAMATLREVAETEEDPKIREAAANALK